MFFHLFSILKDLFCFTGSYSNEVFLDPLSPEEEEECIRKKDEGDWDARNQLIEHNLRLVAHIVKKFDPKYEDTDDLISIGTIGLIKGIQTFQSGKNIKLATYASRCIDNEILMHLRKNKKVKTEVSIDASLSLDGEGNELHLEDVLGTDPDLVSKEIEKENDKKIMLEEVMKLKPRDRDIIVLRYGLLGNDELTQKEVAEKLGISQSYISRIEKKVIKRLRMVVGNF